MCSIVDCGGVVMCGVGVVVCGVGVVMCREGEESMYGVAIQ